MFNRFLAILITFAVVIGPAAQVRADTAIYSDSATRNIAVQAEPAIRPTAPAQAVPIQRLTGETRFETAKAIAEAYNNGTTQNIVVVNGNDISDALSAVVLAHKLAGPILLADRTPGNSTDLYDYAQRHLAHDGNVYIIGGSGLSWGDFIPKFGGVAIHQIGEAGGSRFDTSALIAQTLASGQGGSVVLCAADDYADTLSIASIAASHNWPLLLVQRDSLPGSVKDFLENKKPARIYLVGGETVLANDLVSKLRVILPRTKCERFQGIDRFDTLAKVLTRFEPSPKNIYLTSAYDAVDALVGSVLAAKTGDPLVFAEPDYIDLPQAIKTYITHLKAHPLVHVLGGPFQVSDETATELWAAPPPAAKKTDFVDIRQIIPSAQLDIKYDTTDNFTHTKLYQSAEALLRRGTADKLKKVADEVAKKGFRLKLWDAYRSPEAQFKMWKLVPDSRFVANPYKGYSNHARGSAVDLTLVDLLGHDVVMPTGYDNFSAAAARVNENANAKYLEKVMVKYGFKPLATEWWHFDDKDTYQPAERAASAPPGGLRQNQKQVITVGAVGDITLGQDERFPYGGSFAQLYRQLGPGYFFSGTRPILREDDLTLANLEGTLTQATGKPDKSFQGNRAFFFKGSPAYTAILKDGSIEAVDLANNHSMDYLQQGFNDTVKALERAGIADFGYDKVGIYEKNGIKIGLIGVNALGSLEEGVNVGRLKSDLAVKIHLLKDKTSLIIVNFHWGEENSSSPTPEQRELGHFAVEQGADLVLGHHPHVLQPCEVYQGKCIVYSLGNFVFGGNSNPWDKNTEIFRQKYDFVNGKLVGLSPPLLIPCRLSSSFRPDPVSGGM